MNNCCICWLFTHIFIGYIYYRQHNKQLVVTVFTTTCFDSHESSLGYVQNLLVLALLLLTVLKIKFSRIVLLGILIFKGLTARRFYKSFGVKGLTFIIHHNK
jgi:O-antigen ligase